MKEQEKVVSRENETFTFLLNLMVRLVASQILLLDYARLWSTSQFMCVVVAWGGRVIERKGAAEATVDKEKENSFVYASDECQ